MVRLKVGIAAICLSAVTVGLISRAIAQSAPAAASTSQTNPLLQTLNDPHASQGDRDAAAYKLVSSRDDLVVPDLVAALTQPDTASQLAVARALAAVSWPDPQFIEPLFSLLVNREGQRARVRAAATAALPL